MASFALSLQWDISQVAAATRATKGFDQALMRAARKSGGDAIRFLKRGSNKLIRSRKRFRVARVNSALPLVFPRGSNSLETLEWRMNVSGAPVPVADFAHRQTRKGVTASINAGKRSLIPGAFIATMRSGHTGVFIRKGKARLPIRETFTTRVSDVFNDAGFIDYLQAGAQARFSASFERLLPLELSKSAK